MSSSSAHKAHSVARRNKHVTTPVVAVHSSAASGQAAANDDNETSQPSFKSDPLFGMAIATVIMFAIFAALMALG